MMDIAALIISILSLVLSIFCVSIMVAKEWFSSHTVQMVPLDQALSKTGGHGRPITSEFKEIGDPLTEEEMAYYEQFKEQKIK